MTYSLTSGRVDAYRYENHRVTEVRVGEGIPEDSGSPDIDPGTAAWWDNFDLLTSITYESTEATREHLPISFKRYRIAGNTAADNTEETTISYGFFSAPSGSVRGEDVKWIKVETERELTDENGPGTGTYSSYLVLDGSGNPAYSYSADNVLSFTRYDFSTGLPVEIIRNAPSTKAPSGTDYGLTTTGWGSRSTDGGSLQTLIRRDLLGRVVATTGPGGVTGEVVRSMRANEERTGIPYFTIVSLPHVIDAASGEYSGPAVASWLDAGGNAIGQIKFSPGTLTGTSLRDQYSMNTLFTDTRLGKAAVDHSLTGLVESTRAWHSSSQAAYETTFDYDALGRRTAVTNPNDTIYETAYDVLGRATTVSVGTDNSGTGSDNMEVVAAYEYDDGSTGNGNLTSSTLYAEAGQQAARETEYVYDWRNRLVQVLPPEPPYEFFGYDNLDRVIEYSEHAKTTSVSSGALSLVSTDTDATYAKVAYSQRGLPYVVQLAIDPLDLNDGYLEAHSWFDPAGRTIAEWSPSSPGVKISYDALGRRDAVYVTDLSLGGYAWNDTTNSPFSDFYDTANHATVLTSDTVLEQVEYSYIEDALASDSVAEGQLELITSLRRLHAYDTGTGILDPGTGALTASDSIATYVGYVYDAASRLRHVRNFGTNQSGVLKYNGTSPTITQDVDLTYPTSTDDLVTKTAYNDRGLVEIEYDPEGTATKYFYDDLNRVIGYSENYVDATLAWGSGRWVASNLGAETDRVTSFVYDGLGNVTLRSAHYDDGSEQVQSTEYVYGSVKGATSSTSDIASKDLLKQIRYPDESTGAPGASSAYWVDYAYNLLGEVKYISDQNDTEHFYTIDDLGRITLDLAEADGGSDIDDSIIDRLQYIYDDYGRLTTARSKNGTVTINEIKYTYDQLSRLKKYRMNPTGAIGGTHSQDVDYTWSEIDASSNDLARNYSRLQEMKYPYNPTGAKRTKIHPTYWAAPLSEDFENPPTSEQNAVISRVTGFAWDVWKSGAPTYDEHSVEAQYVGYAMPVLTDYALPQLQHNSFSDPHASSATTGEYHGFDRFNRITRHAWGDAASPGTPWDGTATPAIADYAYDYDRVSNVLSRLDARVGATLPHRDEEYGYDGLYRLAQTSVGEDEGTSSVDVSVGVGSQQWTLDTFGNWTTVATEADGNEQFDTAEEIDRTFNQANEVVSGLGDDDAYDPAGNLTIQHLSATSRRQFTWDPWNRLIKVEYQTGGTGLWGSLQPRASYTYYAGHQRATGVLDTDQDVSFAADRREHFYYNESWQLLDKAVDDDYAATGGSWEGQSTDFTRTQTHQYIWGMNYIDELVAFQVDENGDGDFADVDDTVSYALTDRNYSVIALLDGNEPSGVAEIYERVRYTSYGSPKASPGADANQNGTVQQNDLSPITSLDEEVLGDPDYEVIYDHNRNGEIESDDLTYATSHGAESIEEGALSGRGNAVGYAGYLYEEATGMYCVRFRWLDAESGRWMSRDPLVYSGGSHLYEYARSSALMFLDPFGLTPQSTRDLYDSWYGEGGDDILALENLFNDRRLSGNNGVRDKCTRAQLRAVTVAANKVWTDRQRYLVKISAKLNYIANLASYYGVSKDALQGLADILDELPHVGEKFDYLEQKLKLADIPPEVELALAELNIRLDELNGLTEGELLKRFDQIGSYVLGWLDRLTPDGLDEGVSVIVQAYLIAIGQIGDQLNRIQYDLRRQNLLAWQTMSEDGRVLIKNKGFYSPRWAREILGDDNPFIELMDEACKCRD